LKRARDLLDAVAHAIVAKDPRRWQRIGDAWRILERDARQVPSEALETPPREVELKSPSTPARAPAHATSSPLDETAQAVAVPNESTLPFAPAANAVPPPPAEITGPDQRGETAFLDVSDLDDEPLPFTPAMTLEQYAALCAQTAVHPDKLQDILRRYGLSNERALESLHAAIRKRFQSEPALQQQFHQLESYYRQHFSSSR
jgi:hypothetical protein